MKLLELRSAQPIINSESYLRFSSTGQLCVKRFAGYSVIVSSPRDCKTIRSLSAFGFQLINMRSDIIRKALTAANESLTFAGEVIGAIKSFDECDDNNRKPGTEKEPLISKDSVISLSSNSSSDSEFDDIIPKRRTNAHTSSELTQTQAVHHERRVTNAGTMFHLLKANIWTGLLAMPKAMSHFGLLAGVLGIVILGSIYMYCIHLLLDINRAIVRRVMFDRDMRNASTAIAVLKKESRKAEKVLRKMEKEAEGCVNADEQDFTTSVHWKKKFSKDIEVGEPSSSKKDDLNKRSTKSKEKKIKDIEVGESSPLNKNIRKKCSSNLKGKCAKYIELRESSSSSEDISKTSSSKQKETCTVDIEGQGSSSSNQNISKKGSKKLIEKDSIDVEVEESSLTNKDISKKKYTNLKEASAKDSGMGKSKSTRKDNSEKSSKKLKEKDSKDVEVKRSSSSNEDISKKSSTKLKEKREEDIELKESSESNEDISKSSTKLKEKLAKDIEVEKSSESNEDIPKSSTKLKEKRAKDIEVEEFLETNQDISKSSTKLEEKHSRDIEVEESSESNEDISKISTKSKENRAKNIELEESSETNPDISKKLTTWKKKDTKDFEVEESSSSKKRHSNKSSTKLKEMCAVDIELKESSSSNENISKKKPTTWEKKYSKDFEVGESSTKDKVLNKNPQEQNNAESDEVLIRNSRRKSEDEILRTLDYPKLVELSFHYGMKNLRWQTKIIKFYVQVLMLFTHIGCCCVCFLFVAESLGEMATKGPFTHFNSFEMVGYAVPIMICLSFIPDRHELTGVTTVAVLLQLSGVFMMLYYFLNGEHKESFEPYIAPYETWYLYFGIVFYAFEGTGVTLHLESHMEKKKDLRGWNGILNKSMFFVIPLYAVFGALGYWKIGKDIKASATFNLPEERFTDLIQIMTAMGILLTYPFHLSFVLTPIKKLFIQDDFGETTKQILDLVLRAVLVIFTFVLSALTPYLELQLTVLGASASCFLILVIPPYMSLNSYCHLYLDYSCCRMLFHVVILIIGTAGTVLGSYTTFKNLHLYYPNATIFG